MMMTILKHSRDIPVRTHVEESGIRGPAMIYVTGYFGNHAGVVIVRRTANDYRIRLCVRRHGDFYLTTGGEEWVDYSLIELGIAIQLANDWIERHYAN